MSEPKAAMQPIEYYINGFVRHHEKLSGMAGDRHRNKLSACIQNAGRMARELAAQDSEPPTKQNG